MSDTTQSYKGPQVKIFLDWLNTVKVTPENRLSLLKEYDAYRSNTLQLKPQSTGYTRMQNLLRKGVESPDTPADTFHYIEALLSNSNTIQKGEPSDYSLVKWFSGMPWLRGLLTESDYLRLESPKHLIRSLSATIATTLLFIITAKKMVSTLLDDLDVFNEQDTKAGKSTYPRRWCAYMIRKTEALNDRPWPPTPLTEFVLSDCMAPDDLPAFLQEWERHATEIAPTTSKLINAKMIRYFYQPYIFDRAIINRPSRIEQLLCSWLCAVQAIQPNDIKKLTVGNFMTHHNNNRRPLSIQCNYYKGRSGGYQVTPILDMRTVEAKAIAAYLHGLPEGDTPLFDEQFTFKSSMSFVNRKSLSMQLFSLWQNDRLIHAIHKALRRQQGCTAFLNAFMAMARSGTTCYTYWKTKEHHPELGISIQDYRHAIKNSLPQQLLFGLMAIKNSAVHARSDLYRSNDLINENSHTAHTEKQSYLTDANKEWVNLNGRITRLVEQDMSDCLFRPNLNHSIIKARDKLCRTCVISTLGAGIKNPAQARVNAIGQITEPDIVQAHDPGDILLLDTPETVVMMLYYIAEAERQYKSLIRNAVVFFEQTVIPNVEWMSSVLRQHLSPDSVQRGTRQFQAIKSCLPPLFTAELRGGAIL